MGLAKTSPKRDTFDVSVTKPCQNAGFGRVTPKKRDKFDDLAWPKLFLHEVWEPKLDRLRF